jgi:hypothetical protein
MVLALAPALSPAALAHPARYRHRHPHGARVVVVGRPVVLARPVMIDGVAHGAVDFDVEPETTEVHVDGTMRGQVDQFDGHPDKLYLRQGVHRITLITPEGEKHTRKVRVVAGHEINIKLDFEAGH